MFRVKEALASVEDRKSRGPFNNASLIGLLCGIAVLAGAIAAGGSAMSFLSAPSLLIVLGGTISAVVVSFSLAEVTATARLAAEAITRSVRSAPDAAVRMLHLADIARRQGILPLDAILPELEGDDPFLHKGLTLVVDGLHGKDVEEIMTRDLEASAESWMTAARILRRAAEYAPAMGLIGTLIGLVQMLSHLDQPSEIGPAMSIALLTTLYGAVLANLMLSPLAAKLERNGAQDALVNQIAIIGAASISRRENPRRLEMLLNSVLPPTQRVQYFN